MNAVLNKIFTAEGEQRQREQTELLGIHAVREAGQLPGCERIVSTRIKWRRQRRQDLLGDYE